MLKTLLILLLRLALMLVGVVFFLGLLTVALVLLCLWGLRGLWARFTGRPVHPLNITLLRHARWQRFSAAGRARAPGDDAVIDVEARQVDADGRDRLGR